MSNIQELMEMTAKKESLLLDKQATLEGITSILSAATPEGKQTKQDESVLDTVPKSKYLDEATVKSVSSMLVAMQPKKEVEIDEMSIRRCGRCAGKGKLITTSSSGQVVIKTCDVCNGKGRLVIDSVGSALKNKIDEKINAATISFPDIAINANELAQYGDKNAPRQIFDIEYDPITKQYSCYYPEADESFVGDSLLHIAKKIQKFLKNDPVVKQAGKFEIFLSHFESKQSELKEDGTKTWIDSKINSALISLGVQQDKWNEIENSVYSAMLGGKLGNEIGRAHV